MKRYRRHTYKLVLTEAIIFICFLLSQNFAQTKIPWFEKFEVRDGMSANSTLCILQDSKGFMWFGSQAGLNRFDGYEFKQFLNDPGDSSSIADTYIFRLAEDKLNGIWICMTNTVDRYDSKTGKFTHFLIDSSLIREKNANLITTIFPGKDSLIWFGTNTGFLFCLEQNFIQKKNYNEIWQTGLRNAVKVSEDWIRSIYQSNKGELWVGSNGLYRVTYEGIKTLSIRSEKMDAFSDDLVFQITPQLIDKQNLLINTGNLVYSFNIKTGQAAAWPAANKFPPEYRNGNLTGLLEIKPGLFWIIFDGSGLLIYNQNNNTFEKINHDPDDDESISTDKLYSICKDNSGNVWIGALSGELNKAKISQNSFHKYIYEPAVKPGLSNSYVSALEVDREGILWAGTRGGGLNKGIPEKNNSGKAYKYNFSTFDKLNNLLDSRFVKALKEDSYGYLWVGIWSASDGLFRVHPDRKTIDVFKHDAGDSLSICSNIVRSIFEDSKGNLWIGTSSGGISKAVNYSSPDSKDIYFTNYTPDNTNNKLSQDDIFCISETNVNGKQLIWIGTYTNGLVSFDPKSGKFTTYKHERGKPGSICSNKIRTLLTDSGQNLWIGTVEGLALLSPGNHDELYFEAFGKEDGLSHNEVESILEDAKGNLWIGTAAGLTRFDPVKKNFIRFDENDGLPGDELVLNSAAIAADGNMFFGAILGLLQFHPGEINYNTKAPPVVITSFKVFEKEFKTDSSIVEKKVIELDYDQNFFSLEFAALDFLDPERNKYAYKLEGINNNWIFSENRRYVSYSHLEPGEYIFRVKASNNDGIWNEEGASLIINILPPFWMTLWFRLSAGLILLAAGVWTIRYFSTRKLRRKIRELEIQQKIQYERQRISDDLHDHIGSHLSNIVTGLEISNHLMPEKEKSRLQEHISNLEKYTRSTITELRRTIGSLSQSISNFQTLTEQISLLIDDHNRLSKNPVIEFSYPPDVDIDVSPLYALNIIRICQEAVNNALKYSRAELIKICLDVSEKSVLLLKISDDGTGFNPGDDAVKTKGHGLASMKRRAERMGAELNIHSAEGKGTIIQLSIKLI